MEIFYILALCFPQTFAYVPQILVAVQGLFGSKYSTFSDG